MADNFIMSLGRVYERRAKMREVVRSICIVAVGFVSGQVSTLLAQAAGLPGWVGYLAFVVLALTLWAILTRPTPMIVLIRPKGRGQ